MRHQRVESALTLNGLAAAQRFFAGCVADADSDRENLWVAHVDEHSRCVHLSRHDGEADSADFPLRTIVADALLHGSTGIILAHNHPSGDARPSVEDCRSTRRLAAATDALDCTLLDHLIFAGSECSSMRQAGYL